MRGGLFFFPLHRQALTSIVLIAKFVLVDTPQALSSEVGADLLGTAWDAPVETNSPEEQFPASKEQGLVPRAVPISERSYQRPSYETLPQLRRSEDIMRRPVFQYLPPPDPASFYEVLTYAPPVGLHPIRYREGLFEIYPWVAVTQTYETNVPLTATNPISDFYISPHIGLEFQLGTPESVYTTVYDTILALNGKFETYADLFYFHPGFSAINYRIEVAGRIGRSSAIWRPFISATRIIGSSPLIFELVGRVGRVITAPGWIGEYKFSEITGWNQIFKYTSFQHFLPQQYINTQSFRTEQELTYRILQNLRLILWGEYRFTQPDLGSAANENMIGLGWAGMPDPRIYTDMRIGWDFLQLQSGVPLNSQGNVLLDPQGNIPRRKNLSGLRFHGRTTFDWGPRFRLTVLYDREYIFSEVQVNDNYVSTLLQLKGEFYLGENWYITPYFGVSYQEFESPSTSTPPVYSSIQWSPELEISYALPNGLMPNNPRIFGKLAYVYSQNLQGMASVITDWRFTVGVEWKF